MGRHLESTPQACSRGALRRLFRSSQDAYGPLFPKYSLLSFYRISKIYGIIVGHNDVSSFSYLIVATPQINEEDTHYNECYYVLCQRTHLSKKISMMRKEIRTRSLKIVTGMHDIT